MDEKAKLLMVDFRRRLSSELEGHLKRLIIYGSRARGEAHEESDLDVIALVDEKTPEIEKHLEDIAYQIMWDHDFKPIISLKVFSEADFNNAFKKGFSFYRHVAEEGVSV